MRSRKKIESTIKYHLEKREYHRQKIEHARRKNKYSEFTIDERRIIVRCLVDYRMMTLASDDITLVAVSIALRQVEKYKTLTLIPLTAIQKSLEVAEESEGLIQKVRNLKAKAEQV